MTRRSWPTAPARPPPQDGRQARCGEAAIDVAVDVIGEAPTDTVTLAVAETADASHLATGVYATTGDDVASWARGVSHSIERFALDGMLEPARWH